MSESSTPPELVEIAHACFDFAREGDVARLAAYVDRGVPVDLTDGNGNTLLMLAAYHGHADTVTALVQRGADPDRLNDRGQSPWREPCSGRGRGGRCPDGCGRGPGRRRPDGPGHGPDVRPHRPAARIARQPVVVA